jgi:hypothetical protein
MIAEFQADSVMAYQTIHHLNDIVITADSDQAIHTGSDCLCICDFEMKEKDNITLFDKISIFSGSKKTMEYISDVICLPLSSPSYKNPKFPIVDFNDVHVRCSVAIGIGCDVMVGGIYGISQKIIYTYISKWQESNQHTSLYDWLMDSYISHVKKGMKRKKIQHIDNELVSYKRMINILIESYLYEPANFTNDTPQPNKNLYMVEPYPSCLHPYNNGFDRKDPLVQVDEVDCSVDLMSCVGAGNGSHQFLKIEGTAECRSCSRTVCTTCRIDAITKETNISKTCCIECYGEERCLPTDGITLTSHVALPDKLEALSLVGAHLNNSDDIDEIEDAYEALITKGGSVYDASMMEKIIFPEQKTTYLDSDIEKISEFAMGNGGRFLWNNNLKIEEKVDLIQLFADLVDVPKEIFRNENSTYQVIPKSIRKLTRDGP